MIRSLNFNPKTSLLRPINRNFLHRNLKASFLINVKFNKNSRNNKIILSPNNGKLNFELLHVFYTLVQSGNIAITSEKLGISQPAISLTVKKLEKETGTLLLDQLNNTKKYIKLTSSGLILFNYIQRLFQLIQESLDLSYYSALNLSNINPRIIVNKSFNLYYNSLLNNNVFYTSMSPLNSNEFYGLIKHILIIKEDILKNFETSTKLLIYKNKSNYNKSLNLLQSFSFNKINVKYVEFCKLKSIILLNDKSSNLSKSFVEIQTYKALHTCLELEISSFIYWGSEF